MEQSRLEKLLNLLDAKNIVVRRQAAQQIGDVARLHPTQLNSLLSHLRRYIKSPSSWDARVAAAVALKEVSRNILSSGNGIIDAGVKLENAKIIDFDLPTILASDFRLLGSEGKEFDVTVAADSSGISQQSVVVDRQTQRLRLAQQLGFLRPQMNDVAEIVTDDDLVYNTNYGVNKKPPIGTRSIDDPTPPKLFKLEPKEMDESVVNAEMEPKIVLAAFLRSVCVDLYDPIWTSRHGAALALKEAASSPNFDLLLSVMASTTESPTGCNSMFSAGSILRHVFNVLAVDRFNDFVGEHVVAPVRETCAQLVAAILVSLKQRSAHENCENTSAIESGFRQLTKRTLEICETFLTFSRGDPKQWECRHAGLLTVKYVIGAMQTKGLLRTETEFSGRLWMIFDGIVETLDDSNDDVVIAAAQALLPLVDALKPLTPTKIQEAIERCWQLLNKHVAITSVELQDVPAQAASSLLYDSNVTINAGSCDDDSAADGLFQLLESSPEPLFIDDTRLSLLLPFFSNNQARARQRLASVLIRSAGNGTLTLTDLAWYKIVVRTFFHCLTDERFETAEYLASQLWPALIELRTPDAVWNLCRPVLGQWLACIMLTEQTSLNAVVSEAFGSNLMTSENIYLGGKDITTFNDSERDRIAIGARLRGARLLAAICNKILYANSSVDQISDPPRQCLLQLISVHLNSNSAFQRAAVCMLLCEWSKLLASEQERDAADAFFDDIKKILETLLIPPNPGSVPTIYDEIILNASEVHSSCRDFISLANLGGIGNELQQITPAAIVFKAKEAQEICARALERSIEAKSSLINAAELRNRYAQLKELIGRNSAQMDRINTRISSWLASAYIRAGGSPTKLNPIVQPLMNCVKSESNLVLVKEATRCLANLLETAPVVASSKIVKNLTVLHSSDPKLTPTIMAADGGSERIIGWETKCGREHAAAAMDVGDASMTARNAGVALKGITAHFGTNLPERFPGFYASLRDSLLVKDGVDQNIINRIQVLETVFESLPIGARGVLRKAQVPELCENLKHNSAALRHVSSRCLVSMAEKDLTATLNVMLPSCLDLLSTTAGEEREDPKADFECGELGATELIYILVEKIGANLIGVIPLLAVPILAGMSSSISVIRPVASHTFGQLVKLMPLETDDRPLPGLSPELTALRRKRLEFLHLLNRPDELGRQLDEGTEKRNRILNSVRVNAELRSYQRDGIVWLRFLAEYGLHGILCDDMGLGKTLQTLAALAIGILGDTKAKSRPSLIVCPKTLTSHWMNEIRKFFSGASNTEAGSPTLKAVCVADRTMPVDFASFNVVVTSYDLFRKESGTGCAMDTLFSHRWYYCILDEGHVIRNPKTRLFRALTQLKSDHRLILSGTPVQNSVLELWALFEFLMPGYLGTQSQFQARFGKPILLSRDAKASSAEAESGQAALENLHKLVLPFVLRRRKCDVLDDLPPKIIQDYPCQLLPLQSRLYEDFSRTIKDRFSSSAAGPAAAASGRRATGAFQILLYLRKLCDHPSLVLDEKHPNYAQFNDALVNGEFGADCRQLNDIRLSGKMVALKQLLSECGIGRQGEAEDEDEVQATVSPHRALIFCQFKSVIALIARYLDAGAFGHSIGYRRLDGDVPPARRQSVVDQFNDDPSIDILLLSTQIGGLGLNLTGADVVIFVDHDWNPANDLQAMDRAHRIGQKRTVNVYRLITNGTLEEKMMRLQQFKTRTADALIGEDNRSLMSMATDQLLDLLTLDSSGAGIGSGGGGDGSEKSAKQRKTSRTGINKKIGAGDSTASGGFSTIDLPTLWDQSQYDEAFDYDTFMNALS